jgi:hypothetical protein
MARYEKGRLAAAFRVIARTCRSGRLAAPAAILRRLDAVTFTGMDVVEVAPAYDTAEITALAAATMVWDYLALVGRQQA